MIATPADVTLTHLGAPSLLLGSAALLVFSVAGYTGVAALQSLFTAGLAAGIAGLLAALSCLAGMSAAGAAAVTLTVAIGMLSGYPLIASWIGRLPAPELPDRPEGILEDRPVPRRTDVFASVARAHELLSGMLLATALVSVAAMAFLLAVDRTVTSALLIVSGACALLLRGRLFRTLRQRIPLLVSGTAGLGLLLFSADLETDRGGSRLLYVLVLMVAAAAVFGAALLFSRRRPSPYLGRIADIADVLAIMALIPLTCAVMGMFGSIQGLFASAGG